jgi:signal transduction histidine kinase/CheY-like chemotaxis protein
MRNPLHRLGTVGAKIVWLVALISGTAALAVSVAAGIRGYTTYRQLLIESITAQSLIVASNASAPLSFGDSEMAGSALSALKVVPDVDNARLVDMHGQVLASFTAPGAPRPSAKLYPPGQWRVGRGFVLVVPVRDMAGAHGRLQVGFNGRRLASRALMLAVQTGVLSLGGVLLAILLARGLRRVVTTPVLELERVSRRVRDSGDYSLRAHRISSDELGSLTDAFNEMLERIQGNRQALLEAHRQAEESSRLKDEFVATVSHELRTPLSPILAWIQILRLPRGAAELSKGLDVMERNGRILARIIEDLLDMSRIVSGSLRLDVHAVDINAVIRAAEETLAHAAASRQVSLNVKLASPPPPLRGDPARLQQVVWNLLSNAIKFSPPGSEVSVRTVHAGQQLDIIVEDQGAGMDPAFLPYAFDRFRQEDGSITRAHGGLGLGLAVVRQLVELHGGTVHAESRGRDQGTRFVVSLPIAVESRRTPRIAAPPEATPAAALSGLWVLVVEDHDDMRAVIRNILESAGAIVAEAGNARDAFDRLGAGRTDVLVSDIGLPDLDGYDILRRVRATQAGAHLSAIALTAYARPEEQRRALDAGYQIHLAKPVEPDTLVAAVASAAGMTPA